MPPKVARRLVLPRLLHTRHFLFVRPMLRSLMETPRRLTTTEYAMLGLPTSREGEQRGRPDKAVYRITRAGRATLRAWLEDDTEAPQAGGTVFLLKLFLAGAAPPEAALRQLEAYRSRLEHRLDAFEGMEREPSDGQTVYDRIALAHGIAQARATLGWVESVRPQLEREARRRRRSATRG